MSKPHYFIIRNDVNDHYKILDSDSDEIKLQKQTMKERTYAIFNSETKTWSMKLPHWFTNSLNEDKAILIESFVYFKPDGTSDIGTTVHSPTLIDGDYSQFDYMIGLSTTGINRQFSIASKPLELEFYFKDYLSDERLIDTEDVEEIKTDEDGNYLYYKTDEESGEMTETTEPTDNPVKIISKKNICFIIQCQLIC